MRLVRTAVLLALAITVAEPAMAQTRRATESGRVTRREQPAERSEPREWDSTTEGNRRGRVEPTPQPRDDEPRDRDRNRRNDRDRGIVGPITVLSPGLDRGYDRYDRRYDSRHRVWMRTRGMSCFQLDDELEWAHDEWHYRNDRYRRSSWYDVEHARLEWRIAEERAYSGCGQARHDRQCRDRGHYPRTGNALEVAIQVLDILLRY